GQAVIPVFHGVFQPVWIGSEAFLLREGRADDSSPWVEGIWLKTEKFREVLLQEIADLLPQASLTPTGSSEGGGQSAAMTLASFPWELIPGESAVSSGGLRGPVYASLAVGWVAVSGALGAGAMLVQGVMKLSERRASFVSAVTHELRTPLTTFRLYSDMLESGAVQDELRRHNYYRTLRREADRLSHMVENVLAFSSVERRPSDPEISLLDLHDLLDRIRDRFDERLAGAGMTLRLEFKTEESAKGNSNLVEHILFNLVDNAAKYAARGRDEVVTLEVASKHGWVFLRVRDHGPGIDPAESHAIFHAFHKSAQQAAESKPGVGLGLALSRRLARTMGGDLRCEAVEDGASFVLELPVA
ncbi:MAG: sensor histidine kinase, partial [Verrucomicrobiales bacterium]